MNRADFFNLFTSFLFLGVHECGKIEEEQFSVNVGFKYLQELFENINTDENSQFLSSDKDYSSGILLNSSLKNCSDKYFQEIIVQCLSYKFYLWHWEQTNEGHKIVPPGNFRYLSDKIRESVQKGFEDFAENMIQNCDSPQKLADFYDKNRCEYISVSLENQSLALNAFKQFAPDIRSRLDFYRGQSSTFSMSDAPPSLRSFAEKQVAEFERNGGATSASLSTITLKGEFGPESLTPELSIGNNAVGIFGCLPGAGYRKKIADALALDWVSKKDSTVHPKDSLMLPVKGKTVWDILSEKTDFMAHLSHGIEIPASFAAGKSIGEFRKSLREYTPAIYSKWYKDTLVLTYGFWINPEPYVPWSAVQFLKSAKNNNEPVSVEGILVICNTLNLNQFQVLVKDYPILRALPPWQPILRLADPKSKVPVCSEKGITVQMLLDNCGEQALWIRNLAERFHAEKIRLDLNADAAVGKRIGIAFLDGDGKNIQKILFPELEIAPR